MAEGKYTYPTSQPTRFQDLFVATMLLTLLSIFLLKHHLMLVCLLVFVIWTYGNTSWCHFDPCVCLHWKCVYAEACVTTIPCLFGRVHYSTQSRQQQKTHTHKHTQVQTQHTTVTLCAHWLFSTLATVKAEHRERGSSFDTTVVFSFLFAWNAT